MFLVNEVQTLMHLGLTHRQAKVYLALAQTGTATVRTTSKFSGIPRQHIYKVVSTLQEFGLIEKAITKPVKYKAISVPDGLAILMERKSKEYNSLQAEIKDMIKRHKKNKIMTTLKEEEPQFLLIPEKEAVLKIRGKLCENTQTSLDAIDSWKRFPLTVFAHGKIHIKMWEKGVKSRLILEKPEDEKSRALLKELEKNSSKYSHETRFSLKPPSAIMVIHDRKEALIATVPTGGLAESPDLWTNNAGIISILQDYFEMMWLTALKGDT